MVLLVVAAACGTPPPSRVTCEPDQFLVTACSDVYCVSLPEPCVATPTCACLLDNEVCEPAPCSEGAEVASFALFDNPESCADVDGRATVDGQPIDTC